MSPTRVDCRSCQRPIPDDSPCGCCCWNCDEAPPKPRPGIPHPSLGTSIALALACIGLPLGVLVAAFDASYDIQPSPDGPIVVEVQR